MKFENLFHYVTPVIVFFAALFIPGNKLEYLESYSSSANSPESKSLVYHDLASKHKGMTWVGKGRISEEDLDPLVGIHAEWVMLIPFSYQKGHNSTQVNMANSNSHYWGESDDGIITTARMAKKKE